MNLADFQEKTVIRTYLQPKRFLLPVYNHRQEAKNVQGGKMLFILGEIAIPQPTTHSAILRRTLSKIALISKRYGMSVVRD